MSADLQWTIIRNSASSIVKRNGLVLSRDPMNLMNIHSFKYSGIANKQAVGIVAADKGIKLITKTKAQNKPAKSTRTTVLSGKTGSRRVLKAVKASVSAGHYRPDLADAAMRRAAAILASQKPATVPVKGKRPTNKVKA